MPFACRINKASDAQWGYEIATDFRWQKWLAKTTEYVVISALGVL